MENNDVPCLAYMVILDILHNTGLRACEIHRSIGARPVKKVPLDETPLTSRGISLNQRETGLERLTDSMHRVQWTCQMPRASFELEPLQTKRARDE